MQNLLEQVESINDILRQLQKIDSKMLSGQYIGAYRDLHRLMSFFEHAKGVIVNRNSAESTINPIANVTPEEEINND